MLDASLPEASISRDAPRLRHSMLYCANPRCCFVASRTPRVLFARLRVSTTILCTTATLPISSPRIHHPPTHHYPSHPPEELFAFLFPVCRTRPIAHQACLPPLLLPRPPPISRPPHFTAAFVLPANSIMDEDEQISTFVAFTSATPEQAHHYLQLTEFNVEQAVELFFTSPDLATSASLPAAQPAPASNRDAPITIDDDEEMFGAEDDGVEVTGSRPSVHSASGIESDEAMARRLQEEMYGGGGSRSTGGGVVDEDGVRAPMARTTETLVGPNSDWRDDPNEMNAAIAEQLMQRDAMRRRRAQPGIFNQREAPSIWASEQQGASEADRQAALARATGGASNQSAKSNHLAELFRPPFDLISPLSFSDARDEGKEDEKWILVNVQDPSIFDCQVLNRDIWKNQSIRDTIKEHFIFLQYNKDDPRGQQYVSLYMAQIRDSDDTYPHIGIVDPRTGEQVKTWSGSPSPKAADFLMDLHEFLDRYSLKMERKNPVQTKRKETKKDVAQMTEEEMLEMAMQNSLTNGSRTEKEDPDALTRPSEIVEGKGKAAVRGDPSSTGDASASSAIEAETPFSRISSTKPHEEPPATEKESTRIQFRHSGGRIVHRFMVADPVRRIYEWLKASPLEGKENAEFELILMGKNLIDSLDIPIGEAGLKNASVMVEFTEDG